MRMEAERISKEVRNWKILNTRPVGKPKTRWEAIVQRDSSPKLGI